MKIVWIDDDSYRTKTLCELLEYSGHRIDFFQEYEKGYDFIKSNASQLDGIILDVMMPPGEFFDPKDTNDGLTTGLNLYTLIRKIYHGSILIYTIFGDQALIEYHIRRDRKAAFLAKSANEEEIIAKLQKIR
jgi:CheY-like chemotaxis protein